MSDKTTKSPAKITVAKTTLQKQTKRTASNPAAVNKNTLSAPTRDSIIALQRTAGNQAVQRFLAQNQIQTKLTVGPANDHYEQEADRVAAQVMSQPASASTDVAQRAVKEGEEETELQAKPLANDITPLAQRAANEGEEEDLQAKPTAQRAVEEEEKLQTKPMVQRVEDEEDLQAKPTAQRAVEEEEKLQTKPMVQRVEEDEDLQAKPTAQRAVEDEEKLQTKPMVQRVEEDEDLQAKPTAQRAVEDEEKLQTKPMVQRVEEDEDLQAKPTAQRAVEEDEKLQTKPAAAGNGFKAGADFQQRLNASRDGGTPLPEKTRTFMEARFGTDFSNVRIHTGGESAKLNRAISAQAFTLGQDIYLGAGKENVESGAGKELLAHELTHVVQQTKGGK